MGMMHRLFKVPEFADALKRYDEETAERPKEAPVLRVLRRLNDANNPLQPDDWDHVLIHTDRVLATALYCDRLGFPPSYAEVLERGSQSGRVPRDARAAGMGLAAGQPLQVGRAGRVRRRPVPRQRCDPRGPPDHRERPQARSRRVPLHGAPGQARGPSFHPARRLDPESRRRLGETGHSEPGQAGRVILALDDAGPVALAARANSPRTRTPPRGGQRSRSRAHKKSGGPKPAAKFQKFP